MATSIENLHTTETEKVYTVTFHSETITTTVTADPDEVSNWISATEYIHRRRLHHLVIGLDVEWRPHTRYYTNPVATLQLCVGHRCLIYQILHSPEIPDSLYDFLSDNDYTFVGVGIKGDLKKLAEDYEGLGSEARWEDLRKVVWEWSGNRAMSTAGLKALSSFVLRKEMDKPQWVRMSRWDYRWLQDEQVMYACVDAFVSFEIGRVLNASSSS